MILLVIKIYHAYILEDLQYYPDVISGRKNTIRKTTIPEEKYILEDCNPEYLAVAIQNTLRNNGFFRSAASGRQPATNWNHHLALANSMLTRHPHYFKAKPFYTLKHHQTDTSLL